MTTERVWHCGPPPHVGWWNASVGKNPNTWRWWNGTTWSFCMDKTDSAATIESYSRHASSNQHLILWSDYYPANARVPRVDPSDPSYAVVVEAINNTGKAPDLYRAWEKAAWNRYKQCKIHRELYPLPKSVTLPALVARRVIKALEAQAHVEAAHSQAPDRFTKEETQEWADAQLIRRELAS